LEERVGEVVPWTERGERVWSCGVKNGSTDSRSISDGLRKSVSGEDGLAFSRSSNEIDLGVTKPLGPEIGDVPGTCGISMRTGVCEVWDSRMPGGSGVPLDLVVSPEFTARMGLSVCVPAERAGGEVGTIRSEGLFVGPKDTSSEMFRPSRAIRGSVELEPEMSPDCNEAITL
jgi:hypothetical protein